MPVSTRFEASVKRGTAEDCPAHLIPAELTALAARAGDADAEPEILAALSAMVTANFIGSNVAPVEDLMAIDPDEEIAATKIEVTGFHFGDRGLPSITAYAYYILPLHKPMSQEQLEEWEEEQGEFLTDCVNFFWKFEDPEETWSNVIGEHEGAGMGIADDQDL